MATLLITPASTPIFLNACLILLAASPAAAKSPPSTEKCRTIPGVVMTSPPAGRQTTTTFQTGRVQNPTGFVKRQFRHQQRQVTFLRHGDYFLRRSFPPDKNNPAEIDHLRGPDHLGIGQTR